VVKVALIGVSLSLMLDVCGYRRSGQGKSLPAHVKTLAVPIFQNTSLRYRVEQRFTRAVVDEILRRARALNVTTNPDGADAVLTGDIRSFRAAGAVLDDQGRIRLWDVSVVVSVTVRDLKTRKVLYNNPRLTFEGEYELSDDPQSFFNEENPAVDRIAKQFAKSIVSTILEGQ
jgi:hypothetical protein